MSQLAELDPVLVNPLRRPEPRPPRRGAPVPKARPIVLKIALGLVIGAATFTFAGRLAAFAAAPVAATVRRGQEIRQLEDQLKAEEARRIRLQADIDYLKTPAGIEQEARNLGFVKPGEVPLAVLPSEAETAAAEAAAATPDAAPAERPPAIAERIREAVDMCFTVLGEHRQQGR